MSATDIEKAYSRAAYRGFKRTFWQSLAPTFATLALVAYGGTGEPFVALWQALLGAFVSAVLTGAGSYASLMGGIPDDYVIPQLMENDIS